MRGVVPLGKPCAVCGSGYWCGEDCARAPRGIEPERIVGSVGCEQCRKLGEEVERLKQLLREARPRKRLRRTEKPSQEEMRALWRQRYYQRVAKREAAEMAGEMAMAPAEMARRISRAARAAGIVKEESSAPSDEIPF